MEASYVLAKTSLCGIVIVGITPGRQQMREAIEEARRAMMLGLSDAEVLARAKVHASFAGTMRTNLVKLMDAVGLNVLLGIASTASLWGGDSRRAHFTSALSTLRSSMARTIADRLT